MSSLLAVYLRKFSMKKQIQGTFFLLRMHSLIELLLRYASVMSSEHIYLRKLEDADGDGRASKLLNLFVFLERELSKQKPNLYRYMLQFYENICRDGASGKLAKVLEGKSSTASGCGTIEEEVVEAEVENADVGKSEDASNEMKELSTMLRGKVKEIGDETNELRGNVKGLRGKVNEIGDGVKELRGNVREFMKNFYKLSEMTTNIYTSFVQGQEDQECL